MGGGTTCVVDRGVCVYVSTTCVVEGGTICVVDGGTT